MWSIRARLTRQLMAAFGLLMTAALALSGWLVTSALQRTFDADLMARAAALGSLTEIENGRVQFDFSPDFLRDYGGNGHLGMFFEVWSESGQSLRSSPSLDTLTLPPPGDLSSIHVRLYDFQLPGKVRARALEKVFLPELETAAEKPQKVGLVLAADREALDRQITAVWGGAAAGALLAILLITGIVPHVLKHGLTHLDQFSAQTAAIDENSLGSRFEVSEFPIELKPIGHSLNELLRRLEVSFSRERRFSADLSHELRTPIAELKTMAECARKWPEARAESHDRDVLEIALQMELLVGKMLMLARLENGEPIGPPAALEISEMIRKTSAAFTPAAERRGLRWRVSVETAQIWSDETMLKMILQNLWDNAVEHAEVPGEIVVRGEQTGAIYRVEIGNRATLTPAELEHFFEPLWRKDAARTDSRHCGLGLSLAKRAAARLGGGLSATLKPPGLVWFSLVLPVTVLSEHEKETE